MAITSKSLQLTDENGVNISPVTNLESLYIETEQNIDGVNTVYRQYIYQNWPVHVDYMNNPNVKWKSDKKIEDTIPYNIVPVIVNENIKISVLDISAYNNTNYNQLTYSNIDLTDILSNYIAVPYANYILDETSTSFNSELQSKFNEISTNINASINQINSSISIMQQNINYIEDRFSIKLYTVQQLIDLMNGHNLNPGKLYDVSYGVPEKEIIMTLIADSSSTFNNNVINVRISDTASSQSSNYFHTDLAKWDINFEFDQNNEIKINYIKDSNNNEGNFDFKYLNTNIEDISDINGGIILNDGNLSFYDLTEVGNEFIENTTLTSGAIINVKNNKLINNAEIIITSKSSSSQRSIPDISIFNNEFISTNTPIKFNIAARYSNQKGKCYIANNSINNSDVNWTNSFDLNATIYDTAFDNIECQNNIINNSKNIIIRQCQNASINNGRTNITINNNVFNDVSSFILDSIFSANFGNADFHDCVMQPNSSVSIRRQRLDLYNIIIGPNASTNNIMSNSYITGQNIYANKFIEL